MGAAGLLARRNLLQERSRLALSVAGVALSVMLIVLMNAFLAGFDRQVSVYLDAQPGSVVVAQAGIENFSAATSRLSADALERVRSTPGVGRAVPIDSQLAILDLHGRREAAYLLGYDRAEGGGPTRLLQGGEPQTDDQVVLDSVLAGRDDIGIGSTLDLLGARFRVVGLSAGTWGFMAGYVFMTRTALGRLLQLGQGASFVLVTPASGTDQSVLLKRLADLPGAQALPKADVAASDRRVSVPLFQLPLRLMAVIASVVGALVVGLVVYAATLERRREYAVLKALGGRNPVLYRTVLLQALAAAAAGVGLGALLAVAAGRLITAVRPEFQVVFEPSGLVVALVAGVVMAVAGALLPARAVAGVAPAEAMRS